MSLCKIACLQSEVMWTGILKYSRFSDFFRNKGDEVNDVFVISLFLAVGSQQY